KRPREAEYFAAEPSHERTRPEPLLASEQSVPVPPSFLEGPFFGEDSSRTDSAESGWCYQDLIINDTAAEDARFRTTTAPVAGGKSGHAGERRRPDHGAMPSEPRVSARECPTVLDILAARAAQPLRSATVRTSRSGSNRLPVPTTAREPRTWA